MDKSVDFIRLFKISLIFITLTQWLKSIKNIIVLENSIFVLEIVKKTKKIVKIIFFYKIKENVDFIKLFKFLKIFITLTQ